MPNELYKNEVMLVISEEQLELARIEKETLFDAQKRNDDYMQDLLRGHAGIIRAFAMRLDRVKDEISRIFDGE